MIEVWAKPESTERTLDVEVPMHADRNSAARLRPLGFLPLVAIAFISACDSKQEPTIDSPPPPPVRETHGVVAGVVLDASAHPVSDVSLTISIILPREGGPDQIGDCAGDFAAPELHTASDEEGAFQARVVSGSVSEFPACVAIRAEPAAGSGLSSALLSGLALQFVNVSKSPDTLHVQVSLDAQ